MEGVQVLRLDGAGVAVEDDQVGELAFSDAALDKIFELTSQTLSHLWQH